LRRGATSRTTHQGLTMADKTEFTEQETREMFIGRNVDPDSGMEYLYGLEDENGLYELADINRFINR